MVSRFLYVPNLIGYSRIILSFAAYFYADVSPYIFVFCYSLSEILDMFDGIAARYFNQSTKFGAMLDMVTDRCSTIGLMLVIAQQLPKYTFYCHFFTWLDIFSHWSHMLYQLSTGTDSHKNVAKKGLLQYYYKTKAFMVLLIVGAEGLPLCIYIWSYKDAVSATFVKLAYVYGSVCLPLFLLKHYINVIQLITASVGLDTSDVKMS